MHGGEGHVIQFHSIFGALEDLAIAAMALVREAVLCLSQYATFPDWLIRLVG